MIIKQTITTMACVQSGSSMLSLRPSSNTGTNLKCKNFLSYLSIWVLIIMTSDLTFAMTTQRIPNAKFQYASTTTTTTTKDINSRREKVEARFLLKSENNKTTHLKSTITVLVENENESIETVEIAREGNDQDACNSKSCKIQAIDMISLNQTTMAPQSNENTSNTKAIRSYYYSPLYTAVAASLSAIIFFFGFLGNILVIVVISRTRSMHTTTNCYLLSLSVADSLVLLAATVPAIPETFFRVDEWPYGRAMCPLLIFLQYLGVDASSLSITAFTIERYIAICHPMKAQTMCTLSRAKKIVALLWIFTSLYCSPWLGLTDTKAYNIPGHKPILRCEFRLARSSYLVLYMIDLILFYVIPLIIATILYLLIGRILFLSRNMRKNVQYTGSKSIRKISHRRADSRVQVVRMLVVVVVIFATLWMPYRVMVVYNSFAQKAYMDLWFLLFARTMIYTNCAINPILYNIMSVKFKRAFRNYLTCWHRRNSLPSTSYNEMATDAWGTRRHNGASPMKPQQNSSSVTERSNLAVNHSGHDSTITCLKSEDHGSVTSGTPRLIYHSGNKQSQQLTPDRGDAKRTESPSSLRKQEIRRSPKSSEIRHYHHQNNLNARHSTGNYVKRESLLFEQAV